jgi:HAD superfamily hydrolase (TIGR01490 family)
VSAAFFDLERTLTPHAVEQEAALEFRRRGEIGVRDLLRTLWIYGKYNAGLIGAFEDMKQAGAVVFGGRDGARDERLFAEYFESTLKAAIPQASIDAVRGFQEQGADVWIISSTYAFMVAPYAAFFGAKEYRGCVLAQQGGVNTGRIVDGTIFHQERKADAVRQAAADHGYDLADCHAFGDSTNDLAMLRAVGHPHAVNPRKKLRAVAEAEGWPIHEWV